MKPFKILLCLSIFLLCQGMLVAQNKYKQSDRENRKFVYNGGVTFSFTSADEDVIYPDDLIMYRDYLATKGIGIYSNFIYRFIGVHVAGDFMLGEKKEGLKRFKNFDVGIILKASSWDFTVGVSNSKVNLEERVFAQSDSWNGSNENDIFLTNRSYRERLSGLFIGSGVEFGSVRIDTKYHIYAPAQFGDSSSDTIINGLTIGLGVVIQ